MTFVGYNSYATNRDPIAWGPTAEEFRPERWGTTVEEIAKTYRRAAAKSEIISFHGGRRACLGERFAMLESRITAIEILRRFEFEVDPSWSESMTGVSFTLLRCW
jgi:cytochrome P450